MKYRDRIQPLGLALGLALGIAIGVGLVAPLHPESLLLRSRSEPRAAPRLPTVSPAARATALASALLPSNPRHAAAPLDAPANVSSARGALPAVAATAQPPCSVLDTPSEADLALAGRAVAVERALASAVKSCLGAKCIDERPKGSALDRVLVTALPGSGGEALFRMLSLLSAREKGPVMELTFSHRALPYGYGRNFGFNRILKVVGRPLWGAQALLELAAPHGGGGGGSGGGSDDADAAGAAVQVLRWHCRQKVGHTRSLVVWADELLARRPLFELERAASFAGLKPDRAALRKALASEGLDDAADGGGSWGGGGTFPWPSPLPPARGGASDGAGAGGAADTARDVAGASVATSLDALLGHWPWLLTTPPAGGCGVQPSSSSFSSLSVSAMVGAMEAELARSGGLQKWPCGSVKGLPTLRDRGGRSAGASERQQHRGSASVFSLETGLLPNCSAPFTKCFVAADTDAGEHVT